MGLVVDAPCTNVDGTTLVDLSQLTVWARSSQPDSSLAAELPAVGLECLSIPFDITLAGGAAYDVWVYALDESGNQSPGAAHCAVAVPLEPTTPGLDATYYSGMFAAPLLTRIDPNIDFNWGWDGSPDPSVPPDGFSARWTGNLIVTAPGTYGFAADTNNGVRLWVDGQPVIDYWYPDEIDAHVTGSTALAAGSHAVRVDYFENIQKAMLRLYWTPPGGTESIIPPSAFDHGASDPTGVPLDTGRDPVVQSLRFDVHGRLVRPPGASGVYFLLDVRRSGAHTTRKEVIVK